MYTSIVAKINESLFQIIIVLSETSLGLLRSDFSESEIEIFAEREAEILQGLKWNIQRVT